jgi:uncharacterized membrane protein YhhN
VRIAQAPQLPGAGAVLAACIRDTSHANTGHVALQDYYFALGAFMFVVSDTVLALDRFYISNFPVGRLLVMVTYYWAQALITHGAN